MVYAINVLDPRLPQFAREVAFASQLKSTTPAWTITDNCIAGTTAMMTIADSIALGRAEIGIAGGVESMSNPAVLFTRGASRAFVDLSNARTLQERVGALSGLRPKDMRPDAPGVVEPSTGLSMGEHTEITVKEWGISREAQDEIALRSHLNAAAATEDGRLTAEIVRLDGIDRDTIIRPDTNLEKLAKLAPVFDRSEHGTLTAGNSSPLTDGAAALVLMSEERAQREGREPLAFEAWDTNCPQHIRPRFTEEDIAPLIDKLGRRITELEGELAALTAIERRNARERERQQGGES